MLLRCDQGVQAFQGGTQAHGGLGGEPFGPFCFYRQPTLQGSIAVSHAEDERRRWPRPDTLERLPPAADHAEAVERLVSRRQLIVEDGDVIVAREAAGLPSQRSSSASADVPPATSQYRLSLRGRPNDRARLFASYEHAVIDGEAYAARHRVRLFYVEDGVLTLLKDYRPAQA